MSAWNDESFADDPLVTIGKQDEEWADVSEYDEDDLAGRSAESVRPATLGALTGPNQPIPFARGVLRRRFGRERNQGGSVSHYCDCHDSVLAHRVSSILAQEEHAPIDMRMSRTNILAELQEAVIAQEEQDDDRQARRDKLREVAADDARHQERRDNPSIVAQERIAAQADEA